MSFPLSIPYLTNCINFIFVNVSLIKLKVQLCFHFSVHLDNIQLHQTWLIIISTTTLQTSLLQSMSGSLPSSFCRSTKQSQSTVFHFSGLRKLLQSSICERTRNDVWRGQRRWNDVTPDDVSDGRYDWSSDVSFDGICDVGSFCCEFCRWEWRCSPIAWMGFWRRFGKFLHCSIIKKWLNWQLKNFTTKVMGYCQILSFYL